MDKTELRLDPLTRDWTIFNESRALPPVNGSVRAIAGVLNQQGNVLGMMPHPERAIEPAHGGSDGRALFASVIGALVSA